MLRGLRGYQGHGEKGATILFSFSKPPYSRSLMCNEWKIRTHSYRHTPDFTKTQASFSALMSLCQYWILRWILFRGRESFWCTFHSMWDFSCPQDHLHTDSEFWFFPFIPNRSSFFLMLLTVDLPMGASLSSSENADANMGLVCFDFEDVCNELVNWFLDILSLQL